MKSITNRNMVSTMTVLVMTPAFVSSFSPSISANPVTTSHFQSGVNNPQILDNFSIIDDDLDAIKMILKYELPDLEFDYHVNKYEDDDSTYITINFYELSYQEKFNKINHLNKYSILNNLDYIFVVGD